MENQTKVPSKKSDWKEKESSTDPIKIPLPEGVVQEEIDDGEYSINIVKDYDGKIDPFFLSQRDQDYAYRFLRDDPKNINIKTGNLLFQKGGWQPCSKTHCMKRLGMGDKDLSPDGLCRRGDQILTFMPKKLYDEKIEQKKIDARAPRDAIQRLIDKGDQDNPDLKGRGHEKQKGIQTAEQLGM